MPPQALRAQPASLTEQAIHLQTKIREDRSSCNVLNYGPVRNFVELARHAEAGIVERSTVQGSESPKPTISLPFGRESPCKLLTTIEYFWTSCQNKVFTFDSLQRTDQVSLRTGTGLSPSTNAIQNSEYE
jgi:hypothetical protein